MNLTLLRKYFLAISYTVFMLGFFIFPSSRFHSNFFYVAIAFPFLILILMKKINLKLFFSNRIFLLSTIFLVYMFFTLFWANNYEMSDFFKYGRRVFYILIFIAVTIYLFQTYPNLFQKLLMLLCWTAAIVALGYFWVYYRRHILWVMRLHGYGQLNNPVLASSTYGFIIIASVHLLFQQHDIKMKFFYMGISLVFFIYMLLTKSRGPLLALFVTMIVWLIIVWMVPRQNINIRQNIKNMKWVILPLIAAAGLVWLMNPEFIKSFSSRGFSYRFEIWQKILAQITESPWFGHGLNAKAQTIMSDRKMIIHPHSIYLSTTFYGGIVGLLLLVAMLGFAVWTGFVQVRRPQKFLVISLLLFGALCMVTDGNTLINHPRPFWIFFWFPIAVAAAFELPENPLSDKKSGATQGA